MFELAPVIDAARYVALAIGIHILDDLIRQTYAIMIDTHCIRTGQDAR